MKIHRILCLVTAIVIPQLALAKLPFTSDAFGKVEGTLDFCAQLDRQAASKYQEQKKQIVRDVPEQEVAEARSTQEYKDAYEWVSAELGKVPKNKAVEACAASLEGK
ncbi:MAG TPA: hypothetical protein VEV41_08860 [Terriglobales bacterium]|nr:hypothetical protein [Terriglobales bacterium]